MEMIRYKLLQESNGVSLVIFVNQPKVEFSRELGNDAEIKASIRQEVKNLLVHKFPNVRISTVKIMMGAMLIASFPVGEIVSLAEINQTLSTSSTNPYVNYVIQSGDSLSKIAATNGISIEQISQLNNLTGSTIFVGKTLQLPFVSYTVAPGDSLSVIAKKYYSTAENIKVKNNLNTNTIFIGQRLIIPVITPPTSGVPSTVTPTSPTVTPILTAPAPTLTRYIVIAGDSLSVIAKRFNTTATAIKEANHLSTDMIRIGQLLNLPIAPTVIAPTPVPVPRVPTPPPTPVEQVTTPISVPIETVIDYVVVPRDTLSGIAKKYNTTVIRMKEKNNLTTDLIYVGQRLLIPTTSTELAVVKDTTTPVIPNVVSEHTVDGKNVLAYKISGTTEANDSIFLSLADGANFTIAREIKADAGGVFTSNLDLSSLKDGNIVLAVYAQDTIGNKSNIHSTNIIKDTTGPALLQFNNLSAITKANVDSYSFTGNTDPNSTIDISLSDQSKKITHTIQSDSSGNFTMTQNVNTLSDGNLKLVAVSRDQNGNKGKTFEATLLKDTNIYPVSNVLLENNGKVNQQNVKEFNISGASDEEGAIVRIEISDGVKNITEEALVLNRVFDKQMDLSTFSDGALTVRITAVDQSGNISEQSLTTIQKDTIVNEPVVFTSKIEKTATGFNYKIIGQGEPFSSVAITVLGQTSTQEIKQMVKTDENGRFELELNISPLGNNKPFVTINHLDQFGNNSATTIVGITSYVIGSGDTLWMIANRFNTTIDKITAINHLTSTVINVGQELKLPTVAGITSPTISEQQFFNMSYLYFGSSQTYLDSVKKTANTINVVSPSYFDLNSDGTLKLTLQFDRQFIVSMQSAGIRVVPFLSNHWDRATGEMALNNREQLSTQIADTIRIYNLDGVNVDIENVTDEHRDEYTDFVRLLNEKIPEQKEVSVAVAANPNSYTRGWQGSYDYAGLAKYSDYLMIMAYDESYPGSDPGPIASIDFVEKSIQYAINQGVAEDQVVIGVGHYGRYWKAGATTGGDGISNFQIQNALNLYQGQVTFDEATKSAKATFTIKEGDPTMSVGGKALTAGTYTVWFEDSAAIKAKIDLVRQYGVKGLGNWSLGQDNPQIWTDISSWLNPETTQDDGA